MMALDQEELSPRAPMPLPVRLFRLLFQRLRPRGYMRLGSCLSVLFPSMRRVEFPLEEGIRLWLNLRLINHQQLFLDGAAGADPAERDALRLLVQPGDVVIDVGANLGLYSVFMASLVREHGLVLAYEPDATDLLTNAAEWPQILLRPFAASDRNGWVSFRRVRSTALSYLVRDQEKRAADSWVRAVTLDLETARLGIKSVSVLKIDVEGAEDQVLRGSSELLTCDAPPVLLFEWIPAFRDRSEQGAFRVLHELVRPEWRVFAIGWGRPITEIGWREPDHEANVLAFPPERPAALQAFLEHAAQTTSSGITLLTRVKP